jgi:Flp pilus assembly protein TadD
MLPSSNSHNGHVHQSTLNPLKTLFNLRVVGSDDSHLFELFATLAKEAGRDDLHEEFLDRAAGNHERTLPANQPPPSSEADRLQKEGCRLIREKKLKDAEIAFRKAIKLDPANADAHGNLGVALARQRRLPEAEAAFLLAIRFAPANVTMYVNLTTCLIQQMRHQEEVWAQQAI